MKIGEFGLRGGTRGISLVMLFSLLVNAFSLSSPAAAQALIDLRIAEGYGVSIETRAGQDGPVNSAFGVGDVNGDGFGDLLVTFSSGDQHGFSTLLLFGRPDWRGRKTVSDLVRSGLTIVLNRCGNKACDNLQAADVGDLDGDGIDDLLLGVPAEQDATGVTTGAAYLVYGRRDWPAEVDLAEAGSSLRGTRILSSDRMALGIGRTLVRIGDFDGDGSPDLAFGSPDRGEGTEDVRGAIYVVSASDLIDQSQVDLAEATGKRLRVRIRGSLTGATNSRGEWLNSSFGLRLNAIGDFDGDGFDDFMVGGRTTAPFAYYMVLGDKENPREIDLAEALDNELVRDRFKVFRLPRYDELHLTGGGFAGIVSQGGAQRLLFLGVRREPSLRAHSHRGRVYVFDGNQPLDGITDLSEVPPSGVGATILEAQDYSWFGDDIRVAGDLNSDGNPDWIISADHTEGNRGEIHVVYGWRDLPAEVDLKDGYAGLRIRGEMPGGFLGGCHPVADFNGDSQTDLVATARFSGVDVGDVGSRIYVIYGTGGAPPPFTIHESTPRDGPLRGGTWVTLRGTGFDETTQVFFGSRPASGTMFLSEVMLQALTPSSPAKGHVDIRVKKGEEVFALKDAFQYRANRPDYDLARLGMHGLTLTGDSFTPGARGLAFPAIAPMAFCDLDGDGDDEFAVVSALPAGWQVTFVLGHAGLPEVLDVYGLTTHQVQLYSPETDTSWSCQVNAVGDVNGDGFADLGIGVANGQGYLLFGREDFGRERELRLANELATGRAAWFQLHEDTVSTLRYLAMAPLGDITGDEVDDFAAGLSVSAGELVLVAGRREWPAEQWGLEDQILASVLGDREDQHLADEVRYLGDVDGDEFGDLLIDTQADDTKTAAAYVVRGGRLRGEVGLGVEVSIGSLVANGDAYELMITEGFEHLDWFNIAGPGDVNGDGLGDLLIGVEGGGELTTQGLSYLVLGRVPFPTHLELALENAIDDGVVRILGEGLQEQAGRVGEAGDYNADGYADFLIGGPGFQGSEAGNVHLVYGGPQLPARIDLANLGGLGVKFAGVNSPGGAGAATGPWGDINGDGQPDFAFSEWVTTEGRAHVYIIYGPYLDRPFVRGDANRDGRVDVSDPVFVLRHLFSGGEGSRCDDAADVDDRGQIDLTDAVRLLNYLFAGAVPPAPPHPEAGLDPTSDGLGCLGF